MPARPASPTRTTLLAPPVICSVAGWDPSGGGGLAADQRAIRRAGGLAMGVISLRTRQTLVRLEAVEATPADELAQELELLWSTHPPAAVKLGALANAAQAAVIAANLKRWAKGAFVVMDPVLGPSEGTPGAGFLPRDQLDVALGALLPHVHLLTPNRPEWQVLSNSAGEGDPLQLLSSRFSGSGPLPTRVLLKGGHGQAGAETEFCRDTLFATTTTDTVESARKSLPRGVRGTGCLLSSLTAARVASRWPGAKSTAEEDKLLAQAIGWSVSALQQALLAPAYLTHGQGYLTF